MSTNQNISANLRNKPRIDYKRLHEKGQLLLKPSLLNSCNKYQSQVSEMSDKSKDSNENLSATSSINQSNTATIVDVSSQMDQLHISDSNKLPDNADLRASKRKYELLREEIEDFIDENPPNLTVISIQDIDSCIETITALRTQFRQIVKEIEDILPIDDFEFSFSKNNCSTLASIKEYIVNAKDRKSQIRCQEKECNYSEKAIQLKRDLEHNSQKRRAAEFLVSEVQRLSSELLDEFSKECDGEVTNEEISRRKDDLPSNLLKMDQLSKKFQKCLETIPDDFDDKEEVISTLTLQYDELIAHKESYEKFIQSEIQEREISKEKTFQVSSLNINLSKFNGYDSEMDIYTFQREFEKLHVKSTPKKMLSDLLKYNYLAEPALSLVKSLDNIDEMWKRLKRAYGDSKMLLNKKLSSVLALGPLWKIKDVEKLKTALMSLINIMSDLINLAKYHNIEGKLYFGEGIDMIYAIMGDARVTKWLTNICDTNLEGEELWQELIKFLDKELKVKQELSIIKKKYATNESKQNSYCTSLESSSEDSTLADSNVSVHLTTDNHNGGEKRCSFCNEPDHYEITDPMAHGQKIIPYFSCKKFVEMSPLERFKELRNKGYCYMCLYPGALSNTGKHKNGACQSDFTCKHPSHNAYTKKKHVLVCHEHHTEDENVNTLELYKSKCILRRANVPEFAKNIKLSFMSKQIFISAKPNQDMKINDESIVTENGIYMLQKLQIDGQIYTIFFDSGCSDMVAKHEAIVRLGDRAKQEMKGPISLGGVGNLKTESVHGIYQVRLPLANGKDAVLAGVCLDKITNTFPEYPLNGKISEDLFNAYKASGNDANQLPKLPSSIGGEIDFMIGTKYLRYHPQPVFSLPSGLTIFESPFMGIDGKRGVIGGPHKVITEVDKAQSKTSKLCQYAYLTDQYALYKEIFVDNDSSDQEYLNDHTQLPQELCWENLLWNGEGTATCYLLTAQKQKRFEEVECAGSEILYRCINCRNCQKCRNGERIEYASIKDEVEQDVINQSVIVDIEKGVSEAKLPLIDNPVHRLAHNKNKALAIYNSQVKRLARNPVSKEDVIASENKLQSLGYVEYVKNLTQEQQLKLKESPVQNFIPWSSVWKENSLSTPCRIVFNASLPTETQTSLNDILAKGTNNMNVLVEIFLRWRSHRFAIHTDVQKMYNSVRLQEEDWCLQRYIWQKDLDPKYIPDEKVIKTLIYGVKSSGNQAERALRLTADHFKEDYKEVSEIINHDMYVDDCLSGQNSLDDSFQIADELEIVLMHGGFRLKGFTFSKKDPPKSLSDDGSSINVAGVRWFSKDDVIILDVGPLDFSKRCRGKRTSPVFCVPDSVTRRQCLSKVAEIFDLTGMLTPLTASMKLDLHTLVQRGLDWDDQIPSDLLPIWHNHFDMINEISQIRFKRAVIPDDAISLDVSTLDFADASKQLICVAIYARFLRECGKYSCQLIFSRSKLVPEGMSIPRAELLAANLNAHTGEVVKRALSKYYSGKPLKLTDSQVTMHWLNNQELALKQWIRNRVVEILRFTDASEWKYVKTTDMPADLGTRRGAAIKDVGMGSVWQNGFTWMNNDTTSFPIKCYLDMKQDCKIASDRSNEVLEIENVRAKSQAERTVFSNKICETEVQNDLSKYLIDPNKFRFKKVVRIVAIVIKFTRNCRSKAKAVSKQNILQIDEQDLQKASDYFYKIATEEIKGSMNRDKYEKISTEKDGILVYSGRILPSQQITSIVTMSDTMYDLSETTFCVPLVAKQSPIALSIINEIHWYHPVAKHSGVETVLRYVMKHAYIIEGRELVRAVRRNCVRCKLLLKKTLNVSMGPVSQLQLKIAPAFYVSQTDIVGPFNAYSTHNKRTTIKIWLVVFCCIATMTTSIKVMEDYTALSFIQAFVRFSSDAGYPKKLLIDEGSQLKKGCESMKFSFTNVKNHLHLDQGVEFQICPVGGHNFHGKVERKIKAIRESIEKSMQNERLSILQWETLASQVSNSINDMPIALTNAIADLEYADIITPNRLKLGRNNDRSPVGTLKLSNDFSRILQANNSIFNTWFESWLISYVPKLMNHPKWFVDDKHLKKGDIVLFLKNEKELSDTYQYGMVEKIHSGTDGKIRSVTLKYRNHNENTDRFTTRAIRQLVLIHEVNEVDTNDDQFYACNYVHVLFNNIHQN